ncbi:MAG: ferrous iron transport protein B [Bacteroidetes bacterium]|nr:MAG: ferrous iron transport protein B [Bacteroidota bacterium]
MKILLVGNPNTGKSTLFNQLTGLRQKVGNYAGVTIDKKTGKVIFENQTEAEIIDLPGTYSLFAKSKDEQIVIDTLKKPEQNFDKILYVLDANHLKRSLILFSQIKELGFEIVVALNMLDEAKKEGYHINIEALEKELDTKIIPINARKAEGIKELKQMLMKNKTNHQQKKDVLFGKNQHIDNYSLEKSDEKIVSKLYQRYEVFNEIEKKCVSKEKKQNNFTKKVDKILLHRFWGLTIFFVCLLIIFSALFTLAQYPMEFLEWIFGNLQAITKANLPEGVFTDLLADGILAGLGGIVVFIPQIAILFILITLLEESGYMSRAIFLTDKLVKPFGLNGRSIVPLVSGVACAVPAVMATRTIENWKERLLTIFVTPLMSCSARLPVYVVLIALVVPEKFFLGFIPLQALFLLGLYLLGLFSALFSAFLLKIFIKNKEKSFFVMELPTYKTPSIKNITLTVWEKVRVFVIDAGKIILAISIILWFLGNYAPAGMMEKAEKNTKTAFKHLPKKELENKIAAAKLEVSYMGILGKTIEPIIKPLGYDWKIGIALIASFAAREVFVGTISTIYSLGQGNDDLKTVQQKLKAEINPSTNKPQYNFAVCVSLMIFYAFAMQCMSTIGAVYRETKSIKWTLLQLFYMTLLAYISSFGVYNLLQ